MSKVSNPGKHSLGDAPIEPEFMERMKNIGHALDRVFNGEAKGKDRKIGFVLLMFHYGDSDSRCNYISNGADRKDIVTLFKEQIKRFEGQPEIEGHA
jgi:hypothetical protein